MKVRVFSGLCVLAFLLILCFTSGIPFVLNALMAAVAAMAIYEILKVAGISENKPVTLGAVAFAAIFVFCSDPIIPQYRAILTAATFLLILLTFTYYLRGYQKVHMPNLAFALFMTLLVAYFFSAMVLVRRQGTFWKFDAGFWNLALIFVLAWVPDTGAYFCGSLFGKHKLAPVISPKKTLEGAVGGLVITVAASFLFVWGASMHGAVVDYRFVAIYAILGTAVSILGDLTASLIKRFYNIKDYGNLIPGHGGIMDRFDSIWFVAPFVYLMIQFLPIFS